MKKSKLKTKHDPESISHKIEKKRWRGCTSKRGFKTEDAALIFSTHLDQGRDFVAYKCNFCDEWHLASVK